MQISYLNLCGCLEPRFEYHNTISHFSFQVVIDYDDLVKIPYFRSEIESLTNEAPQLRYLNLLFVYILNIFPSFPSFLLIHIKHKLYIVKLGLLLTVRWQINKCICLEFCPKFRAGSTIILENQLKQKVCSMHIPQLEIAVKCDGKI